MLCLMKKALVVLKSETTLKANKQRTVVRRMIDEMKALRNILKNMLSRSEACRNCFHRNNPLTM